MFFSNAFRVAKPGLICAGRRGCNTNGCGPAVQLFERSVVGPAAGRLLTAAETSGMRRGRRYQLRVLAGSLGRSRGRNLEAIYRLDGHLFPSLECTARFLMAPDSGHQSM